MIGAAHLSLYLLLTANARSEAGEIESRYTAATLEAAKRPGERPDGVEAAARWTRQRALWEAAETWDGHRRLEEGMRWALIASFVVQTVITVAMLRRSLTKRHR